MKQPTIEELKADLDVGTHNDGLYEAAQAMLKLMRDIEAGKVAVVPCDHVTDDMRKMMKLGGVLRQCFADTFIDTVKAAPDMMAGYWGMRDD